MPDQLFIYYIEDPLVILFLKKGSWGVMAPAFLKASKSFKVGNGSSGSFLPF
jgi:hypothetical protein